MNARVASLAFLLAASALSFASNAHAEGESIGGFPNWAERVLLEWTNRARADPAVEMATCGGSCPDASCYSPQPPLYWNEKLTHSARFHSRHAAQNGGYLAHDTPCKLVSNLASLYPGSCNAPASCACVGGTMTGSTGAFARMDLFGAYGTGEVVASVDDPDKAFRIWLYEPSTSSTCAFSIPNGHRWTLLTNPSTGAGTVGYGVDSFGSRGFATGDFGLPSPGGKIPSGSHYPRSGSSVEIWANWNDAAAPSAARVDLGGTCQTMTLTRGSGTNGAWLYTASGLSGCTRYYFSFKDSGGAVVTYPSTGSLGIGDASCADWDATRPAPCDGGDPIEPPGDAGVSDAPAPPPPPGSDAAPTDAGSDRDRDGALAEEPSEDASIHGSCGCRIVPAQSPRAQLLVGLGALVLVLARRSKKNVR